MDFSNTTSKNGIIQTIERWTGLGDTTISADSTLLKLITASVNEAFDEIMPLLLSFTGDTVRWDDTNNTDLPVCKIDLISGQFDYTIAEDDNGLDILNMASVRIYPNATATQYMELTEVTADDPRALAIMSPSSTDTGTPSIYLKRGNTLHFFPKPNYSATDGIQLLFEREQSYFASTDTIKEPGIPRPFHKLLAHIAAHEWLVENKPTETVLITRLETKITDAKKNIVAMISKRNPVRRRVTMGGIAFR